MYSTGATGYGCSRPFYTATKLNSYTANYRTMYLRTSFNNWGLLPMVLVKNNVWEGQVNSPVNTQGWLKFDINGDWVKSFGRPSGSNGEYYINAAIAVTPGDNLGLYVQDSSGATTVTAVVRFNDQTLQFSYCPSASEGGTSNTALCQ